MLRKTNFQQLRSTVTVVGSEWGTPSTIVVVSDVLTVTTERNITVESETGVTDTITQILGLDVGDEIRLSPKTGHTITVNDGANMLTGPSTITLNNVDDTLQMQCIATGKCKQTGWTSVG